MLTKDEGLGNSLAVQWLGLCTFTAGGMDSIPGQGTKISGKPCGMAKEPPPTKTKNQLNKKIKMTNK